jgi:hypothetical protein
MERKEVIEIIKAVETFYQGKFKTDDPKALLDAWHGILKDYEFDLIHGHLIDYVKNNRFPPSVSDLLEIEPKKDRAIPTYEETKQLLHQYDQGKQHAAPKEVANNHLAEMRKLLDIKRG